MEFQHLSAITLGSIGSGGSGADLDEILPYSANDKALVKLIVK